MESGREAARKTGGNGNEVVVTIASSEEISDGKASAATECGSNLFSKNSQASAELERLKSRVQATPNTVPSSPEIARSPNQSKRPKIPAESVVRRRSLGRSAYSKPKSRLLEPSYPIKTSVEEKTKLLPSGSPITDSASPIHSLAATTHRDNVKTAPATPRTAPATPKTAPATPRTPTVPEEDEEEDDDVYKTSNSSEMEKRNKKFRFLLWIEWIAFVLFMGCLIANLTVHRLLHTLIWGLELWKWSVLVLVIFCGRLVTEWCINVVVFMIERNFLLRKKVLYFVYGLKKSVLVFIWLGLILLAWGLLINRGVKRSRKTTRILNYVTRALASSLIGAAIWLVKTLLVKMLASSFHVSRFFDRIQESIFHQYVLQILSRPPSMEGAEMVGRVGSGQLSFRSNKKGAGKEKEDVIDVEKLHKIKQEKVSAWTMKGLIQVISGSGLTTLSNALDDSGDDDDGGERKDKEITNEWEARNAASQIFRNVAKNHPKYIDEEDLLRFMPKKEVDNVFPLFEGASETRKIRKSAFKKWVVNVYLERKSLAHSLNDTKTAIEELNKIASGLVLIVIIIVWLLLMGFATTKVLVFISSQLLLVTFMFGNTCKTLFEAMIFVFVMHPFDVGDRCVIDGVQMIVEEINILTTIFLRYDNEKIFYPNSVLSTKPISNFYRSPEMGDSVEFTVDFSTSMETIAALKDRIKKYLESKPEHWRPGHSVLVKDIVNMNQMIMGLYVTHTINFQNYGDKSSRRSELMIELKKIFEELGIKYCLLPQEVHVRSVDSAPPIFPTTMR